MLLMLEDTAFNQYRPRLKKWTSTCTAISAAILIILIILLTIFSLNLGKKVHIVYIQESDSPMSTVDEKFLSIALDTSLIANNFKHFDITNPKVLKLLKALSPAYLRIGGTMADRLLFTETGSVHFKHFLKGEFDGSECSYEFQYCDYLLKPNFTMDGTEWLNLNKLATGANLSIIFDLNSLRRFDDGSWDYRNAEKLLAYSAQHDLDIDWELGNEPNAYRRQFNYEVSPSQLAQDFHTLAQIIAKYSKYENSTVVGPDVTRPEVDHDDSMLYLLKFLEGGVSDIIDAVTWHQYYFNGATATFSDFLDPEYFDILEWQIKRVLATVNSAKLSQNIPIWLGETSSAYGGGAPHLSDRYVATFLWLDKLGLAAKYGVNVVIRQSFFQGYYALINNGYIPTPDWWVSVLYKKLVGTKVVNCHNSPSKLIRLYCQCTKREYNDRFTNVSSVTVFGVNISSRKARIRFEGIISLDSEEVESIMVDAYILTTSERIDSRFIYLNEVLLSLTESNDVPNLQPKKIFANPYVEMPAYSLVFWVIPAEDLLPYC